MKFCNFTPVILFFLLLNVWYSDLNAQVCTSEFLVQAGATAGGAPAFNGNWLCNGSLDASGRNRYAGQDFGPPEGGAVGLFYYYNTALSRWEMGIPENIFTYWYATNSADFTPNPPSSTATDGMGNDVDWVSAGTIPDLVLPTISGSGTQETPGGAPAPIELSSFRLEALNGQIHIHWSTSTELNNDYMIVQRTKDGLNFEEVGQLFGAGTTSIPQAYSLVDYTPFYGISYYRIVQVDFDGSQHIHPILSVDNLNAGQKIFVAPNPTSGMINLNLLTPSEGPLEVKIRNIYGQLLAQYQIASGALQTHLEGQQLPNGIYFLSVDEAGRRLHTERIRIVK